EFVEHVVLISREYEAADRQTHRSRDVTGEDVAEVAGRHGEIDEFADALRDSEITLEVIHDLRRDARPVDRVHRAEAMARLEFRIAGNRLHQVLAIVEHAV